MSTFKEIVPTWILTIQNWEMAAARFPYWALYTINIVLKLVLYPVTIFNKLFLYNILLVLLVYFYVAVITA